MSLPGGRLGFLIINSWERNSVGKIIWLEELKELCLLKKVALLHDNPDVLDKIVLKEEAVSKRLMFH